MQVYQIMASPVKTIDKDQPVSEAIDIMAKYGISALPVTDNDQLIGLITELDLVDRLGSSRAGQLTPANIYVSAVMEWNPETLNPATDITDAAKHLLQRRERALTVVEDNAVVGIVTNTHFVNQCLNIDNLLVRDLKLEKPISVRLTDRVVHARQLLLAEGAPGIPVFEKGKVVGLVTKKRLVLGFAAFRRETPAKYQSTRLRDFLVSNILVKTELTTYPKMPVGEAAELLTRGHQHLLPVMENGKMISILIRRSMVDLVANQFQAYKS